MYKESLLWWETALGFVDYHIAFLFLFDYFPKKYKYFSLPGHWKPSITIQFVYYTFLCNILGNFWVSSKTFFSFVKKIKKNLIRFVLFICLLVFVFHNDLQCVRFYGKSCNITLDIFRVCKELFSLYNAVRLITAFSHWTLSIWTLKVCQTLDFEFALPLHSVNLTCAKQWLQYK